ncbi:MAG TPA: hypothetical protein VGC96_08295 [Candidatus Elarobacter sp.]|jgi:hypothetical protein
MQSRRPFTALVLVVVGLAIAPALSQTPSSPAPSASTLPEIGRTRATRLPCAVIRDLVAPSIGAAIDASAAFEAAKGDLRRLGLVPGQRRPSEAPQTMSLMALDRKKSAMAKDVIAISRALGDARVAMNQTDPATRELRDALQGLYDAENAKLNALSSFLEAQRWSQLFNEDETLSQIKMANDEGLHAPAMKADAPRALATPATYALPTPPRSNMIALQRQNPAPAVTTAPQAPDRAVTADAEANGVAATEARASRTIVRIAQTCR